MGNVTKKSIISGLVWVRGSLGEDQPSFQVVVNKPITLDQGEKIAMLLKQSIDEARAQIATAKTHAEKQDIEHQPLSAPPMSEPDACEICESPGHRGADCPNNQ